MLSQIRALFKTSIVVQRITILASGTALAQLVGICAMPLITRLYSPEEIGIAALFLTFIGFWLNTIAFRYEHALLNASDDVESHLLIRLCTFLVVLMSILAMPLMLFLQESHFFEFQQLPDWAPIIVFPILLGSGLSLVFRFWALRGGLIDKISQTTVMRSVMLVATKISMGLFGAGILGLLVAELVGAFASTLKLMKDTIRFFAASRPAHVELMQLCSIAFKYSKFPRVEMPSAWLDTLAMLLPLPIIASLYGVEAAGWFGLARMVVSLPNSQVGSAIADVFQMQFATLVIDRNNKAARSLFNLILSKLALIGLLPFVITIFALPFLFSYVFGNDWSYAGLISASLAPWLYMAFVVSPLSRALTILQEQEFKLLYDSIALGLMVACYFISKNIELTLLEFCFLMSITQAFAYIAYGVVIYLRLTRRLR